MVLTHDHTRARACLPAAALAYFFAAVSPTMEIAVGALPLVSSAAGAATAKA